MQTLVQPFPCTARKSPYPTTIHTTLYNLIAALSAEVGPDEEDVLTATVVHLLNTHRVTCNGNLQGYRLVCDGVKHLAQSGQKDDDLASYVEMGDEPC
jgi:hypothetical protein